MALAQSVPMLVQAEAMTLVAPMAAGNDIAAMGGRFISATSGTSTMSPARSASVQVNVPAAGAYYLWARIAGPTATSDALYVGIDASFARVFPQAQGPYEWVKVATSDGSGVFGFSLAAGAHTIQVGYGEIGAKLDAVYLTANAAEVPAFTPPARLAIEAEALNLQAPMTVGSDVAANGGQFISPTSGTTSTTPVREASTTVQVSAGTYYLWARIAGPTTASDALYVGIDSSFARVFPTTAASGSYEWVKVAISEGSTTFGFALTAGAHVIQVGHGEIGARLDGVYLTADANEVPTLAPMRRMIEAETMTLTPPMTVGNDAEANGTQYISPTSGTSTTVPVREASTTLNVSSAGTYYLWARLKGPTIDSDALYVGFDNTFIRVFPSTMGVYEWVRVEATAGSINGFTLSAGAHDIQVGHGEIGARLDALYVTDSASDTPSGSSAPLPPPPAPGGACALPSGGYEGFGRNTLLDPSLPAREVYPVNSRADPGVAGTKGTLRDAVSQPNRCIVFAVGGEIDMTNQPSLRVKSNVIVDGFTAPGGITLVNHKPTGSDEGAEPPILNIENVNNVVVRGIRVRSSPGDAIRVDNGAFNVVLDHVSVTDFGDGAIDVVRGSRDVTIQWSILGKGRAAHNFVNLIGLGAFRVSAHHNLYVEGFDRQPMCSTQVTPAPPAPVCDVRNNLIWNYGQKGTTVRHSATGNVIRNYYRAGTGAIPEQTIRVTENGVAHVSENISQDNFVINDNGNRSTPFPVDAADIPATTDARTAAIAITSTLTSRDGAGARGPNFELDTTDKDFIRNITIR